MFSLPGILVLVVLDYFKPQEIYPILLQVPWLYVAMLLALLGFLVDLRIGVTKLHATPQLSWAMAYYVWCIVTVMIRNPADLGKAIFVLIPISLFFIIGHSVTSFRGLHVIIGLILAMAVALAIVGVDQAYEPFECHQIALGSEEFRFIRDGRECQLGQPGTCTGEGSVAGVEYVCERPGMFETSSIAKGRVRFRGTLADPNELALALGIALPFAFAIFDRRRGAVSGIVLVFSTVLFGACAMFTQSRGGQLVFLAVIGVYFIKQVGIVKGLLVGIVFAAPILLLGGRSDADADSSTLERLEAWYEHFQMFKDSQGLGVGYAQFVHYHFLTAHSSYILALSELGLPGLWLFTGVLYVSMKIPIEAMRGHARGEFPPIVGTWGTALFAAMVGTIVGIALLSFNYKEILWIYFGLCGALYQAIRRHHPTFEVRVTRREMALMLLADVAFIVGMRAYLFLKLGQ